MFFQIFIVDKGIDLINLFFLQIYLVKIEINLINLLILFFQIYKDVKNRNARQMSMSRTAATTTQQARRKQVKPQIFY